MAMNGLRRLKFRNCGRAPTCAAIPMNIFAWVVEKSGTKVATVAVIPGPGRSCVIPTKTDCSFIIPFTRRDSSVNHTCLLLRRTIRRSASSVFPTEHSLRTRTQVKHECTQVHDEKQSSKLAKSMSVSSRVHKFFSTPGVVRSRQAAHTAIAL